VDELESLRLQAAAWGLSLSPDQLARLGTFARFLRDYEEANVIGTRKLGGIILDHILDSLSCFLFEPLGVAPRLVDVGSGGGLPGVPIKIVKPGLRTTLVESTAKKVRFLQRVAENLSLEGVEVKCARVEEVARADEYRGTYDVATARAVARLSVVGVGLMISSVCQTQQQAIFGVFAAVVPIILISGFATPVENMPQALQILAEASPLKHFLIIVQGSFLKALPAADVFANLWPLAAIAALTLSMAVIIVQRRLQ
jgi:16S rRNA (guanine(527)-N(7))-methyltransferase RsmG